MKKQKKISLRDAILFTCTLVSVSTSIRGVFVSNESLKIAHESLRQNQLAKEEEKLAQKPDLGMTLSSAVLTPGKKDLSFSITFQNTGHRKAYNLRTTSYLVRDTGALKNQFGRPTLSTAAELGAGLSSMYRYPVKQPENVKYLLTIVHYDDPVMNKTYTQKFLRKWHHHELVIPPISEQSKIIAQASQGRPSSVHPI